MYATFKPISGISTSRFLIYLKKRRIEGPFDHIPPTHPPTHPDNKGFRDVQKGRYSRVFFEDPNLVRQSHIKWKDCKVDPLGHCFRSFLRGIKFLGIPSKFCQDFSGIISLIFFIIFF